MIINMFLLACEVFTEFYTDSAHVASARYLYFGLHGRDALVPWIWTAIGMNLVATALLMLPASRGLEDAERRLRAVDRRHLDRKGDGADRAGLRARRRWARSSNTSRRLTRS